MSPQFFHRTKQLINWNLKRAHEFHALSIFTGIWCITYPMNFHGILCVGDKGERDVKCKVWWRRNVIWKRINMKTLYISAYDSVHIHGRQREREEKSSQASSIRFLVVYVDEVEREWAGTAFAFEVKLNSVDGFSYTHSRIICIEHEREKK